MKKPIAKFVDMGGFARLDIYLVENATEKQNNWEQAQGKHIFSNELLGVARDLKADGFIIKIVR